MILVRIRNVFQNTWYMDLIGWVLMMIWNEKMSVLRKFQHHCQKTDYSSSFPRMGNTSIFKYYAYTDDLKPGTLENTVPGKHHCSLRSNNSSYLILLISFHFQVLITIVIKWRYSIQYGYIISQEFLKCKDTNIYNIPITSQTG